LKAVYLEWYDSSSFRAGDSGGVWKSRADVSQAGEPCRCTTIGFILAEDEQSITIGGSYTGGCVSGDMNIPKSAITKRRVVRWKK